VKRSFTIRRVFVAVVAAAIALTPSSRLALAATPSDGPVMAHGMVMPAMAGMHGMAQDMAMPGDDAVAASADMPCCPQQAPSPVDCDKCVVMAGCMAQCFSGVVATAGYLLPPLAASIVPQHETVRPTSLGRPPPEYPPRSLV
jgi:hypothetical protein